MQFITRIKSARSFPELQKVILEAKKGHEFNNAVIHEAIRKLTTRDCKNVKFGYELCRQIPIDSFPSLHRYTLESILNCSSQVHDFRLAHKSFRMLKNPKSFDFYYYVNSFKKAKANELSPEMIEELGSLWKKVELSVNIENDKLLTQLFSVLSFSKEKQRSLMNYLMSKPANISFTCGLLGILLKYCSKVDDLDLARKVWDWGHSIRERERGTVSFFQISYQFYTLFPPSISELNNLWSQVKHARLDGRVELVNSMCKSLSFAVLEQRKFIEDILSKDPNEAFDCSILGGFLKHCSKTNDLDLAKRVWAWGRVLRDRELNNFVLFLITYQYYDLFPPYTSELMSLWNQVKKSGLDVKVELVNSMCKSLSFDIAEQRKFIKGIISKESNPSFTTGILGGFLKHCSETKDLKLAQDIWCWGQSIRESDRGTIGFFLITYQYYDLFPPSLSELWNLWNQVKNSGLDGKVELVNSMCKSLSFDIAKQRKFIKDIISKEPNESFNCGVLGGFLKHCSETNDLKLAQDIWCWGQCIRDRDCATFGFFLITYQFYDLFPPSISELRSLWSQVVTAQLNDRVELVNSMCSALSPDRKEQRNFILSVISKEPKSSFHTGVLGPFLKHCSETNDINFARDIWKWGQPIKESSLRDSSYVLVTFQYLTLCESVTKQREFIINETSNPAPIGYHCGVIGTFLSHCSDQNNLELARRVWSWGLDIRSKWKGTSELRQVTIQYLCICKGSGDLSLLEEVWREAKVFGVGSFKEVLGAFINALAANGAVDRVLNLFGEVPCNIVDEHLLTSTLNSLSHAGRDLDALNILRRVQNENPKIISSISYNSVIDAFARNGNFEVALSLIEEMKHYGIKPNAITWTAILSPCRFYKNLPVALKAFEELQKVDHGPEDITSAYVLLADVYKSCGDLISYNQLHEHRKNRGLFKTRGGVQLCLPNSETLSFFVNDIPSSLEPHVCDQIFETLDDWRPILEKMGLSTESVSCRHSEMLALAYAISVLKLKRVVMRKNLRVCLDCHAATVAISKFSRLPITIQDESRVHVIMNGVCSCQGKY